MHVSPKHIFILASMLGLPSCETGPREVFVPLTEPAVELVVRASASEVLVGEPVVLYAERRNWGEWKLVEKKQMAREQCWLRHPPPNQEKEVSDNLRWDALPSKSARFNTTFRGDHTREVIFGEPGTFILESSSKIPCRPENEAKGKPIKIVVRSDTARAKTSWYNRSGR